MKEYLMKFFSREFITLVILESFIMKSKPDLLLDENNIILVMGLLGFTTVKRFIDTKNGKAVEVEKVVPEVQKEKLNG